MLIDVRNNIPEILGRLSAFEKKFLPLAMAKALTFTAEKIEDVSVHFMSRVFSPAPTRYTINALYKKTATVRSQTAGVFFKDSTTKGTPAPNYLLPHVIGGTRRQKRHEKALAPFMQGYRYTVPGRAAPLDGYGNIPGGVYQKMISQVRAYAGDLGYLNAKRKKGKSKARERFFVAPPNSNLRAGIWKRKGKSIEPHLIFVSHANYRANRFPFYHIGKETTRVVFPKKFEQALNREMRRAFEGQKLAA
jgi:hypothetical protein